MTRWWRWRPDGSREELDPEGKDESGTKETEGKEVIFETRL